MEAQLVEELPRTGGWQYEPKWDGFRGVLENDGGELALWSRNGRPLLRYFPELAPLGEILPPRSALDGEVVIERGGRLDFDAMQMRLHPAESRVRKLAAEVPARFVVFDVLLWDSEPVHRRPLEERRAELLRVGGGFDVSPATSDPDEAWEWLETMDALGLDGIIAKRLGLPYLAGSRDGVVKVKRHRTADCVVVGVRWADAGTIATLLLGLYDGEGELKYVGAAAAGGRRQAEIAERVTPLIGPSPVKQTWGEPSRWRGKELESTSLRPELVVEVRYDKWQGSRFRHGTRLLRFREDKDAAACTLDQVEPPIRPGDPTVATLLGS
jgi:ATP-dependent DNA ligase